MTIADNLALADPPSRAATLGQLESSLKIMVKKHAIARHPFYRVVENEGVSALYAWAHQQYFMSISLAPCFAALYARVPFPYWPQASALSELALEETWGNKQKGNHGELFGRFFESLGGSRGAVDRLEPTDQTREVVAARLEIASSSALNLSSSIFAIAYGNEFANLYIFGRLLRAARKSATLDQAYMRAHLEDETTHLRRLLKICSLAALAINPDEIYETTLKLLNLRVAFFDQFVDHTRTSQS